MIAVRGNSSSDVVLDFLRYVEEVPSKNISKLLDRVLSKSRVLCRAEAGTIFTVVRKNDGNWLKPVNVQNDRIRVSCKDFLVPIDDRTIAGHVALTGAPLAIDDVYNIPRRAKYSFNPRNEHPNYTTKSMLCFPLKNLSGKVIGLVQLINATRPGRASPVPFTKQEEKLVSTISSVIGHFLERSMMLQDIRSKNKTLRTRNRTIADLQGQTEEAFQHSITLLSRAAEIHDEDTGNHVIRVNKYSKAFAELLGMPSAWCEEIGYSAQLHDVGKMSVNSAILKKQGSLTEEEREEMNQHTVYGYHILRNIPRFEMAADIALAHHERWDGTGYPNGIKGEQIPLAARITQVADIYDALRSARSYKPPWSHQKTLTVLTKGDGRLDPKSHFDPELINIFKKHSSHFSDIWHQLKD